MTVEGQENQEKSGKKLSPKQRQKKAVIGFVLLVVCFIIALTVGLVLNDDDDDDEIVLMKREGVLVDCSPELRRNEEKMMKNKESCVERGCVFKPQMDKGAPWCLYPTDHGYSIDTDQPIMDTTKSMTRQLFKGSAVTSGQIKDVFDKVSVTVEFLTKSSIRIKLFPTNASRWEIPESILNIEASNENDANNETSKVEVSFVENPFGIVVTRKDTGTVTFNSGHPGTLLADQFLQLTTSLPSGHLYGFGEHRHLSLHHDLSWKTWAMFTRDAGPNSDWNLYGQHPVYLNVENDGKANMVLLKNSNAMEVLLQPEPNPAVTFTTIGGVLDFYIYVGDSPADVTAQYVKSIGLPVFPPYWSLGYHLSRWGYANSSDMKNVYYRNVKAGIPFDGQWADIDTFYKKFPFTYDPENWPKFPEFVTKLRTNNHRYFVTIVDPGVGINTSIIEEIKKLTPKEFSQYDIHSSGVTNDIFVQNSTDTGALIGKVWPGETVYPDFTDPKSKDWWKGVIDFYVNKLGIKADALWIDMNEPSSFVEGSVDGCQKNKWNNPAWCPNILGAGEDCKMYDKTLCMDAKQDLGDHYNVHSLYGHSMAMKTYESLAEVYKDKRPWTMTRSSFVGTGHYATKWQGDNEAKWDHMHFSIISLVEFGFFGFAMNGADICGFWLEPSFELCVRWHQLGAFYPFARNHNGKGDNTIFKHQDPVAFGQNFVDLVKPVLLTRYKLLPYLYTRMYNAHVDGEMVMQPLFYQFPKDARTLKIDTQFMLGPALLVSPVLKKGATSVTAYFPKGRWFDYLTGEEIISDGHSLDLDTPLEKFNLHIRGGHVIPWQEPSTTTSDSRKKGLGLIVALDEYGKANGEMFWDDGKTDLAPNNYNLVKFFMEEAGNLTIKADQAKYSGNKLNFETIEIYGLTRLPTNVKVNGKVQTPVKYQFINDGIIRITGLNLPMTATSRITWSLY